MYVCIQQHEIFVPSCTVCCVLPSGARIAACCLQAIRHFLGKQLQNVCVCVCGLPCFAPGPFQCPYAHVATLGDRWMWTNSWWTNENLASPHIVSPKALTRRDTIWNRWLGDVRLPSLLFEFCAHCLVLASLHELFLALQAHVAAPSHTPVPPNSLTE